MTKREADLSPFANEHQLPLADQLEVASVWLTMFCALHGRRSALVGLRDVSQVLEARSSRWPFANNEPDHLAHAAASWTDAFDAYELETRAAGLCIDEVGWAWARVSASVYHGCPRATVALLQHRSCRALESTYDLTEGVLWTAARAYDLAQRSERIRTLAGRFLEVRTRCVALVLPLQEALRGLPRVHGARISAARSVPRDRSDSCRS